MITKFSTISDSGEGLFKDRGSKFLSFAYPVKNETEIKERLDQLRKQYHDARHHCYAWKIGTNPSASRSNDDGEPSNSAGKPILNQIEKQELINILIVVIRYFGGTLLGVGGLINAYRTATENCLENCNIITKYVQRTYLLKFEYPLMNDIMKVIKEHELEAYDQIFEISCSLKINVNLDIHDLVIKKLNNIRGCVYEQTSTE